MGIPLRSGPRSMARPAFLTLAITAVVLFPSHDLRAQATTPKRTATCQEGLRVYGMPSDVPAPYDTIMPDLRSGGVVTNGMQQISSVEGFMKQLLQGAADLGATGYINYRGVAGESTNNAQSLGRTLPVFVASDSARALAVCRAKHEGKSTETRPEEQAMARPGDAFSQSTAVYPRLPTTARNRSR